MTARYRLTTDEGEVRLFETASDLFEFVAARMAGDEGERGE